jgi:hypothetical protein
MAFDFSSVDFQQDLWGGILEDGGTEGESSSSQQITSEQTARKQPAAMGLSQSSQSEAEASGGLSRLTSEEYGTQTTLGTPVESGTQNASQAPQFAAIAEEMMCACCLEIQVRSTTLVPCGHTFCETCCTSAEECPTCRLSVAQRAPCRNLRNMIGLLVQQQPPIFSADDLTVFQQSTAALQAQEKQQSSLSTSRRKRRRTMNAATPANQGTAASQEQAGTSAQTAICID